MDRYQLLLLNHPDILCEALSSEGIRYPNEILILEGPSRWRAQREYEDTKYYPKIAEYISTQDWESLGRFMGKQVEDYLNRVAKYRGVSKTLEDISPARPEIPS